MITSPSYNCIINIRINCDKFEIFFCPPKNLPVEMNLLRRMSSITIVSLASNFFSLENGWASDGTANPIYTQYIKDEAKKKKRGNV